MHLKAAIRTRKNNRKKNEGMKEQKNTIKRLRICHVHSDMTNRDFQTCSDYKCKPKNKKRSY